MTGTQRLANHFVTEARERGLIDVKFFPTTDASLTKDECAEAVLSALLNPNPMQSALDDEEF